MLITAKTTLQAAHRLWHSEHYTEGKCTNIHGHSYTFEFVLEGEVVNDMVIDFAEVKKTLISRVNEMWDHNLILADWDPVIAGLQEANRAMGRHSKAGLFLMDNMPTIENMVQFLIDQDWGLPEGVEIVTVRGRETEKYSAIVGRKSQ